MASTGRSAPSAGVAAGPARLVGGECVLRYDNERGKGDHRHAEATASPYGFSTPAKLVADFESDVARWNDEHGRA